MDDGMYRLATLEIERSFGGHVSLRVVEHDLVFRLSLDQVQDLHNLTATAIETREQNHSSRSGLTPASDDTGADGVLTEAGLTE